MGAPATWRQELDEHRQSKDRYLRDHPHSPLPPERREGFEGLDYFDPNPDYRVEATFAPDDRRERITVRTSTEGEREYVQWGELHFTLGGERRCLRVYRQNPDEAGYWLPFRDETNGEETYDAGRYLDLDPDDDRTGGGDWVLDFNRAYSPFCAYSPAYECPLVPVENWLDVRIEAGEKAFDAA
jgi:hypothetical protein